MVENAILEFSTGKLGKTVERQSLRLVELKNPSKEELMTIRMKDVGIVLKDPNASDED